MENENITEENNEVQEETVVEPAVEEDQAPQEDEQEINWRKFREERKKDREAKREAERKAAEAERQRNELRDLVQSLNNPGSQQLSKKEVEEVLDNLPEDKFLTAGDLNRVYDKKLQKGIEEGIAKALEKREKEEAERKKRREIEDMPNRLKEEYTDFYEVVNEETLDRFEFEHPELAQTFKELPDTYGKWTRVYKAIKRYQPGVTTRKNAADRYEKNQQKPRSASTPGYVPAMKEQPKILTQAQKDANWERMKRQWKGSY